MLVNTMPSYYELGTSSNMNANNSFCQLSESVVNNTSITTNASVLPLLMCSTSKAGISPEVKAMAACRSHKEAERRRRRRINDHLATLRTILPNLIKTDKASVLGEVVRRMKDLKKATLELTSNRKDGNSCLLPGDIDEVKLIKSENDNTILIATLCCEDRPELIVDLTRALKSVKGKVVRAEMATIGGRMKSILWVRGVSDGGGGVGPEGLLKRALKVVVDKPSSSVGMGLGLIGSRVHRPY